MDLYLTAVMYLLGALFMTIHFEPQGDGPRWQYVLFVFFWPLMTLWFLLLNFIGDEEE